MFVFQTVGFLTIHTAFIESTYRPQAKLMGFNPTDDVEGIASLRKPFTTTPGLHLALLKEPHYEDTGGMFMLTNASESDSYRVVLTCAHVAHPPPSSVNRASTRKFESEPRKDVILLGTGSIEKSVTTIMEFIGEQSTSIRTWKTA